VELPLCGSDFLNFAFCTLIFEFDVGQWAGWGQQYHGVVDSSLRQGQFGPGKTVSVTVDLLFIIYYWLLSSSWGLLFDSK